MNVRLLAHVSLTACLFSGCASKTAPDSTAVSAATANADRAIESIPPDRPISDRYTLTIVPALMQSPWALAFLKTDDGSVPQDYWTVQQLGPQGGVPLGATFGAYQATRDSGTGRGPQPGNFASDIPEIEFKPGDEIPWFFDLRGISPGTHLQLSSASGLRISFKVAPGETDIRSSVANPSLCRTRSEALPDRTSLHSVTDPQVAIASVSRCDEIPPGVWQVSKGALTLGYVRGERLQ